MNHLSKNIFKVVRTLRYSYVHSSIRLVSTELLNDRKVIRVSGDDVASYLQGLITNDVQHLDNSVSMYALFLNTKGRVLYDTIIYRTSESNKLYLECDKSVVPALIKHLNMYKVRRKISVDNCENEFNVWAISSFKQEENNSNSDVLSINNGDCITLTHDPRVQELGFRGIALKDVSVSKELQKAGITCKEETFYDLLRCKLGIGEGVSDMPPGSSFPLECNCDYMHGVSFHKGCYIGQELTARTHHTGVVRKRLMPLSFEKEIDIRENNTPVFDSDSKNVGKIRSVKEKFGIGLLRISEALQTPSLLVNGVIARTEKPGWWATEAPKEKQNTT